MEKAGTPSHSIPVIPSRYAQCFLRFMEIRGISREALLEGTGVTTEALSHHDSQLCMTQLTALFNRAEMLFEDELIPLQLGQSINLMDHGLAGIAILHRHDTRKLAGMIIQYLHVCLPMIDLKVHHDADRLTVRLLDRWNLGHLRPFVFKIYLGCIHRLSSRLGKDFSFQFDFSTRLSTHTWEALLSHGAIEFNAPQCQISMTLSGKPAKNNDDDIALYLAKIRTLEQLHRDRVRGIPSMVRRVIAEAPGHDCTLAKVAEQLKMTSRSLRHQLRLSGITFHHIRNEIRQTYATRYLTDTSLPLERIADELGYSGQASFTKAYSTWTGKTPGRVRRTGDGYAHTEI